MDESYEGATAWWPGPPKGAADVLSVVPGESQLNLRFATALPPGRDEQIWIYPPQFLAALLAIWQRPTWSVRCLEWLRALAKGTVREDGPILRPDQCQSPLRTRQREAFGLARWSISYLWGPPGTGKTYTLGALLARLLVEHPSARVLLLSTTNTAVDQALVAVDRALEADGVVEERARRARRECARLGTHFVASHYDGREHLLPVKDERLLQELIKLEGERPAPEDVVAYDHWKRRCEAARAKVRAQAADVLKRARLVATTTTGAAFRFQELLSAQRFDFVIFDEASQVGIASASALAPLGTRVLFAGDPCQLAPIVQADDDDAKQWLGESMFAYMESVSPAVCRLNEQSRMSAPICDVVSRVFYDGALVVASDCRNDRRWMAERTPPPCAELATKALHVHQVDEEGQWSARYRGPIRFASAQWVAGIVAKLRAVQKESEVLVLTPFRAQRALLRQLLRRAGCGRVVVSTVHRAQGSECHTVIFDPVMGSSPFLHTDDARRLVNVALSRAKARLVLLCSAGDRTNPMLRQIADLLGFRETRQLLATPLQNFLSAETFPVNAIGHIVDVHGDVVRVEHVTDDERHLIVTDVRNGQIRKFLLERLKASLTDLPVRPAWTSQVSTQSNDHVVHRRETPSPVSEPATTRVPGARYRLQQAPTRRDRYVIFDEMEQRTLAGAPMTLAEATLHVHQLNTLDRFQARSDPDMARPSGANHGQ